MIQLINLKDIEKKIKKDSILFFDMDGTLVDTDYANFLSYEMSINYITKSAHKLTYNPIKRFNRSQLLILIPNLTESQMERIIKKKEQCYKQYKHETTINQIVADIINKYEKQNKTVLVTNCREERALEVLNYHNFRDKFDHLFFRRFSEFNEKINKFSYAIQTLQVPPESIVLFENEIDEIEDAILAGINSENIIKI